MSETTEASKQVRNADEQLPMAKVRKKFFLRRWFANEKFAWSVVFLWMAMIFKFSAQAHSGEVTEVYLGNFNVMVRKFAHMCEYFGLFLFLRNALSITFEYWTTSISIRAFAFVVFYAMTDEFHQSFVPGRSATIYDVGIDATGAAIAWLLVGFVLPRLFRKQ